MTKKKHAEFRLFPVSTRFQTMAQRPGGMRLEEALANADAIVGNQRETAADVFRPYISQLHEFSNDLTNHKSFDLEQAFAAAFAIRDIAGVFQMAALSEIADSLASCLEAADHTDREFGEVFKLHVQAMRTVNLVHGDRNLSQEVEKVIAGLRKLSGRASVSRE